MNAPCSSARGDIFTAPIEKGPTRNLTHSSGAHDKWPSWSPDGSQIAFISDMSGEEELYVVPQDGLKPPNKSPPAAPRCVISPSGRLTENASRFSDKDGKVFVVTLADQEDDRNCRCAARSDS